MQRSVTVKIPDRDVYKRQSLEDALLGKVPGAKKHGEEKNAKKEE